MNSRLILRIMAVVGTALVVAVLWFTQARPVVVLPRIRLSPGYSLLNAVGKTVTSEDQRGKLTLYSFAYTRCADDCRPIYSSLQQIDVLLGQGEQRTPALRLVTLTIDPVHDTPEALAAFSLPFTPQALEWVWLTGPEKRMKSMLGGSFEVLYQPQEDGSIFFAPRYVLVDGNGIIRAMYDTAELDPERFNEHLDLLYQEIEQSTGAARLAYEAAHFFACYPH